MELLMRVTTAVFAALLVLAAAPDRAEPAPARAGGPEIVGVDLGRSAAHVTCDVRTANLPGDRLVSSLESGLPSAVQLDLRLLDDRERVVAERRVFLRVAFDLWEEVFRVEGAGAPRDFADLAALQGFLERVPRLAVSPLAGLHAAEPHRIRVGMRLHPVAPRETERLGDWVAGRPPRARGEETDDADGREVSVGLGELIRFFYKGARREGAEESERFSAWFVPDELPAPGGDAEGGDAPDPH
jgi:hypothetical protein